MRLRTKLIINAFTMVALPLILMIVAYYAIGSYMIEQNGNSFSENMIIDSDTSYEQLINDVIENIDNAEKTDPKVLEKKDYLEQLNLDVKDDNAFILVRKGTNVYYNGSAESADSLLKTLPAYGFSVSADGNFFVSQGSKLVRQRDFKFSDGEEGSLFIVLSARKLIAKPFLSSMCIAIAFIMVFTSLMLTLWIRKGLFTPISELNVAMQQIKGGNFDYRLPTNKDKDEIGEMYRNYEDMRLRLKESADEKLEHERQNKELLSNISHDLKTPITAIKGYAEGLIEGVAVTPEKQIKYVRTIYSKANDMNNLINELTLYSSIDNNRIPYNFHKINVGDYFGDCIEEVGVDLENKNIKLNYSNLTSPETSIIADPEQLKRVVNNIISNSVKYLNRDDGSGQIDIRILDEVDSIRVEIEDNGKGISQKDIGNIFDRFYRTDSSRNSKAGGSGIGLSIVKKIIEDHGGYIWATSHEGEGTCMHFVIRKYVQKNDSSEEYSENKSNGG